MVEQERDRVMQLSSRIVRDRLFRRLVLHAYDKRCAITGLKLINGGGRAEVDAKRCWFSEKDVALGRTLPSVGRCFAKSIRDW
ncbi:Hypothetical protein NGAL_HAMBI2427_43030 [Neorhizobium galegae bv. orientalis]|nr:Hypothetical protein NGAL_HAMBI2427_43030 [Neorhizobium galegae bv. orientalis]